MKTNDRYKGVVTILLSTFSFACMNFFIRLAGDLPFFEKSLFRNSVSLVVALVLLLKDRQSYKGLDINSWLLLALRSFAGGFAIFAYFYAIDHMVISDAQMLLSMSSFFSLLFSFIFLKEKLALRQFAYIVLAFVGSLLIVKPQGIGSGEFVPALLGLTAGMLTGVAMTSIRALGKRGVTGSRIVFAFSLVSTLLSLPFTVANYVPISGRQLACLLIAGCFASAGQFAVTAAYHFSPAKDISIYEYTSVLFAAILGFVFLNMVPDVMSIAGYLVIFVAAWLMFEYTKRH